MVEPGGASLSPVRRSLAGLLCLPAVALALAGCGAAGSAPGTSFQGDQKAVADAIGELGTAARAKDAQKICSRSLSRALAAKMQAPSADCISEVGKAIGDADGFDLQTRSVQVQGTTATAQVREGKHGATATVRLVKEGGTWRVDGLG